MTVPPAQADWYITTSGNDSNPCTQASPCASLERAYRVASIGDVVNVASGSIPGQLVDQGAKVAGGGYVTFQAQPGAVFGNEIRLSGVNDINFVNFVRSDDYTLNSSYIEFNGGSEQSFYVRSSDHITYQGGSVGGLHDGTNPTIGATTATLTPSRYITINNVSFHDIDRRDNRSAHIQCLFLQESDHVWITNSSFTGCGVMNLYMHAILGGENPTDVTITGNTFGTLADDLGTGQSDGYYALMTGARAGETMANITFDNNTYGQQRAEIDTDGTVSNFRFCDGVDKLAVAGAHGASVVNYNCG